MKKKRIVIALGHEALGSTLPEQQKAAARTAKAVADFIREDYQVVITHSNGPQVGMIHTAMNEFCRLYPEYTATPTSVCSAMSQGYIGYDLQNAIRAELLNRGIYKTVSTILTQVVVDPYDEAFYKPSKIIGRVMTEEEAEAEEDKGNFVTEVGNGEYRRILAAPKPQKIVELETIRTLADAGQVVIAAGGDGWDPRTDRCGSDRCCLRRRRYTGSFPGQSFKGSKCSDREGPGSRKACRASGGRYARDTDKRRQCVPGLRHRE